jgi:pyruvate/2-oxoglutarate dehydrogenase complex dihydrolipoamide dehydrogenase (E3) component
MKKYDIIVIGAGSGGLSVGNFMVKAGFKVLMVSKTAEAIGGECLNDGCVPSKALIHVAGMVHNAREASQLGLTITTEVDMQKVHQYIYDSQEKIREHENQSYFEKQGFDIAIGSARFVGLNDVAVDGKKYTAKKIVIATGSRPRTLEVSGIEKVIYYDNESIFKIKELPKRLLIIGGGPIGIEIAQAFQRLGSKVTIVHHGNQILKHDDKNLTAILTERLDKSGIDFHFESDITHFESANKAFIKHSTGTIATVDFDSIFVAIGRQLNIENLDLEKAGITVKKNQIVVDDYLRTSNKNVLLCGDVAGNLQFSHAAEQHGRLIINNLFSPFKKKLNNKHMSWVTFTDPELATFGLSEKDLKNQNISYEKLEQSFNHDDRAIVDDYEYGQLQLYIRKGNWFKKEIILGGSMLAPKAGELIQELILANTAGISINKIVNKIYPYPVAARINQKIIVEHKQKILTEKVKKILRFAFKIFA